jgi:hypothetical protein
MSAKPITVQSIIRALLVRSHPDVKIGMLAMNFAFQAYRLIFNRLSRYAHKLAVENKSEQILPDHIHAAVGKKMPRHSAVLNKLISDEKHLESVAKPWVVKNLMKRGLPCSDDACIMFGILVDFLIQTDIDCSIESIPQNSKQMILVSHIRGSLASDKQLFKLAQPSQKALAKAQSVINEQSVLAHLISLATRLPKKPT